MTTKSSKNILEVSNINKRYDQRKMAGITDISFNIKAGKCYSLIGPSGSGKTTTLKVIADLLEKQSGEVQFAADTKVAYVAQTTELPADKTVFKILEEEILDIEDDEKRENQVRSSLSVLGITNEIHSLPKNISGGQRQRVIIAKALVTNPNLILLDEPFSHLDEKLRFSLMQELFSVFKDQNISVLWVTHETKEALSFSDQIIVLNHGIIQQIDSPKDIYQKPNNLFVANFFGQVNLIAAKLVTDSGSDLIINALKKEIVIHRPLGFIAKEHNDVLLVIRPEHIKAQTDGDLRGKLTKVLFQGSHYLVEIQFQGDQTLWAKIPSDLDLKLGQKLAFSIDYHLVYCLNEI